MESKIIYLIKSNFTVKSGLFIECFIEQAHQFGNLDESRTGKLRDRGKAYNHHSTYEWIGLNGNAI